MLTLSPEEGECAQEDDAGGDSHEDDGVAVCGLGFGWCGGGAVAALGAALRVGLRGDEGEEEDGCEREAFHVALLIIR